MKIVLTVILLIVSLGLLNGKQPAIYYRKPLTKHKQVFRYLLSKTCYDSASYLYKVVINESGNLKSNLSKNNNIAGLRYVPNSKAVSRNKQSQYLYYESWQDCIDDLLTYQRHYNKRSWYYSKRYKQFMKKHYEFSKTI